MAPSKIDEGMFRSASRTLAILMSFVPDNSQKSINDISKTLGLSLPTTSRLVRLLEGQGFLQSDSWSNKYSLGRSAFDLGQAITGSLRTNLVNIAKPYIDDLKDKIGLNVALEVLLGDSTILAYAAWSQRYRFGPVMGQRMPLHIAAGAKAILAFSSPEFVDEALHGELIQLTPKTITDAKVLKEQLEQFRSEGVAYDFGGGTLDLHVLAVPVFDYEKRPVAAVATGDLAHKVNGHFDDRIIALVKETAAKISTRLFYHNDFQQGA
jgi:IclR family transcriptional regulator, KDG regulon repressor